MRRARKEPDKLKRRQTLVDAAWSAFQTEPYEGITVANVAEKAGLAKGTVYLYFKTKEELFLAVQEEQFDEWFGEIDARLQTEQANNTVNWVTSLVIDSLRQRPALVRLLAILPGILEHHIDFETALHFKRMLLAHMLRTGTLLERLLPFLEPGQGSKLILRFYALVVGFQNLADPSPVVRQVLQEPDLRVMDIDFITELSETVQALLAGLESEWRKTKQNE